MKRTWKEPILEVLDVSMTMKWHGGAEPGEPGEGDDDVFDS